MTSLQKFDYTPDPDHSLSLLGRAADAWLGTQCVGKLREASERESSSRLFLNLRSFADTIRLGRIFQQIAGDSLPENIKQDIAEAQVFLMVIGATLAQRYLNGTLEPELHEGKEAAAKYAREQVAREDQQQADTDRPSPVNQASDGIA